MSSKIFSIPEIGQVVVHKHPTSKKISIKLRAGEKPKVVIPKLMPFRTGLSFAEEKKDWIKKHLVKLEQVTPGNKVLGFNTSVPSKFITFIIAPSNAAAISIKKQEKECFILIPQHINIEDAEVQESINYIITEELRKQAKNYLPERLKYLAMKYGFSYNKVAIKNAKTRWGSCSGKNNINLNLHLMRLPEHLSDFIILHELCHTIHKNHGPHFHALMNKLVGDEKKLNKELKAYHIDL